MAEWPKPDYVRISECAQILGIPRSTAYLWVKKGLIHTVDLPSGKRVTQAEVNRLLAGAARTRAEGRRKRGA